MSVGEPDIPQLVRQAQRGDRGAFEQLVRATARIVYAQIVASVRDRQKAEDLTQETFLAAWRAIQTVKDSGGFVTWVLTLARNTVLDHVRAEGRKKRKDGTGTATVGEAAAGERSPSDELERAEARANALRLLEELPADYRQPLMLRYLGGADYETIRRQLNLSDGALRGLLNRGMALLRERMTHSDNAHE
jgi:RNA polymerase sigma-70 factor (ECF subfamily)